MATFPNIMANWSNWIQPSMTFVIFFNTYDKFLKENFFSTHFFSKTNVDLHISNNIIVWVEV